MQAGSIEPGRCSSRRKRDAIFRAMMQATCNGPVVPLTRSGSPFVRRGGGDGVQPELLQDRAECSGRPPGGTRTRARAASPVLQQRRRQARRRHSGSVPPPHRLANPVPGWNRIHAADTAGRPALERVLDQEHRQPVREHPCLALQLLHDARQPAVPQGVRQLGDPAVVVRSFQPRSRTFDGNADGRSRIRSTSPRISVSGSSWLSPARTSRSPRSAGLDRTRRSSTRTATHGHGRTPPAPR